MLLRRLLAAAGLVLAACATEPTGRADLLDFLHDGATPRDEVYLHLGEPSAQYENGRILAYRLKSDEGGYSAVAKRDDWSGTKFSLILVFDDSARLAKHSLVPVQSP